MKIGFTGSSSEITEKQINTFIRLVTTNKAPINEFHHGDCVVADETAHKLIINHVPKAKIVIHPPTNPYKRAFCKVRPNDEIRDEYEYMVRNQHIINEIDILVAISDSYHEKLRSGTWSTIRKGIKQHKKVIIIFPDGSFKVK
jgi:hypothetical protein